MCVGWAADEWGIISTVGNLIVTVAHSSTVGAGVFVFKASSKTVCGGATSAWRTGLEAMDFSRSVREELCVIGWCGERILARKDY